jgi:hypothetical protein
MRHVGNYAYDVNSQELFLDACEIGDSAIDVIVLLSSANKTMRVRVAFVSSKIFHDDKKLACRPRKPEENELSSDHSAPLAGFTCFVACGFEYLKFCHVEMHCCNALFNPRLTPQRLFSEISETAGSPRPNQQLHTAWPASVVEVAWPAGSNIESRAAQRKRAVELSREFFYFRGPQPTNRKQEKRVSTR